MAVDLASHHDSLVIWLHLQLDRLLEAALGFLVLRLSQVLLVEFEIVQSILLYCD